MRYEIKYMSYIFFLVVYTAGCSQSKEMKFIKKDKYQSIYILQDKNSPQYDSLIDFSNFDTSGKATQLKALGINLEWIPVYKYNNKYYLHIPCDGINDVKYLIDDNYVQIQSSEVTRYAISSITKEKENVLIYYTEPDSNDKSSLKISPIDKANGIYKFSASKQGVFNELTMIDVRKYKNYDLIVNKCIDTKAEEFQFDK